MRPCESELGVPHFLNIDDFLGKWTDLKLESLVEHESGTWRKPEPAALHGLPEIDPVNFVSRVELPVLMLGGKYDFDFPVETSQKPCSISLLHQRSTNVSRSSKTPGTCPSDRIDS
jgi:hypothetical protein